MRKSHILILLVALLAEMTGCSSKTTMQSSSSSSNMTILSSTSESSASCSFSNEEIDNAKKAAKEYYKSYTIKPISFKYDTTNSLYKHCSLKYDKSKLIVFTVTIENSEDPPRGIALVKTDSDWKVVGEGY